MKAVGKILAVAVAYVLGVFITGMLGPMLHFPAYPVPAGFDAQKAFLLMIAATPLLAVGLVPLASGMRGHWISRCLAMGVLLFVAIGLNTIIEALIFTNMLKGSSPWLSVHSLFPCFFAAAVLAWGFGSSEGSTALRLQSAGGWSWRILLAWLAFPACYYVFGMCVAPFVIDAYNAGIAGLMIPAQSVIIRTQLLRSAIFLAASFPAILLWKESRGQFIFAMGLAHAMAVGIFQLIQGSFLPGVLRVAHSIEITADSFAYAAVLGLLFISKQRTAESRDKSAAAASGTC